MRRLSTIAAGLVCLVSLETAAAAATCAREDFAKAVNGAGAALRQLNTENAPRLQAKMRQLKTKMGWPDAGYEEKAFQILQDERIAALDAEANDRLARIDTLGTISPSAEPDCGKLQELSAASLELQATVKAKTNYMLSKLDQMLGEAPRGASPSRRARRSSPPRRLQPPSRRRQPRWSRRPSPIRPPRPERSAKIGSSRDVRDRAACARFPAHRRPPTRIRRRRPTATATPSTRSARPARVSSARSPPIWDR